MFDAGTVTPGQSVALERAVFDSRCSGHVPDTLFFYSRDRRTVSLGRFGRVGDVLDESVETVRRMSGGGAILTGPGTIIASLAVKGMPRDDVFKSFCEGIASALGVLGIDAEYKPPNDVMAGGRKISGGAQYRSGDFLLHHAMVAVEGDPEIWSILRRRPGMAYDATSVSEILGHAPDRGAVVDALAECIARSMGLSLERGRMTELECLGSGVRA